MRKFDLESLVRALQSAVRDAQTYVERRHWELLHQLVERGSDASVRSTALSLSLPARDGAGGDEAVRLPLLSLVDRRPARIAELSMEFDCELREVRPKNGSDAARRIVVFHGLDVLRRNRHRVKVTIFGRDGQRAEVMRDGTLIEEVESGAPDGRFK